ncbi:MAG: molybdopterin molybdotransferase [Actinomycetota bacterium]|jgi:molybdopterin molybdotransferase|nr:molybdopterin molybdotransferase [Actinomycetota bacterium]
MRSVDEHLAAILQGIEPVAPLDLQLLDAHGCILAEEVVSDVDLPPFDNSSMDGYAVRVDDLAGAGPASPVTLPVVGDVAAGSRAVYSVQHGLTVRIMTGAQIPAGAEAVVPIEWTDRGLADVNVTRAPEAGAHIRRRGEDVHRGDVVLAAGTRLGPGQLGILAAIGRDRVTVRPRPRVVILSTGSELVEPGQPTTSGQIHESNSYVLTSAAREAGATAFRVGIVPDDPHQLMDAIEDQLIRADLVLTSGGVSVGAYDVVKEVLSRLGTVSFEQVAMQPGKPQGFGTIGPDSTPIITLPGNPVSAYVSFEVFVRPVIRRMLGVEPLSRPVVRAVLGEGLTSPAERRQFARAWLDVRDGRYVVTPVGGAGSHLVAGLAHANALIVVPEDVTELASGDAVDVMVLERRHS